MAHAAREGDFPKALGGVGEVDAHRRSGPTGRAAAELGDTHLRDVLDGHVPARVHAVERDVVLQPRVVGGFVGPVIAEHAGRAVPVDGREGVGRDHAVVPVGERLERKVGLDPGVAVDDDERIGGPGVERGPRGVVIGHKIDGDGEVAAPGEMDLELENRGAKGDGAGVAHVQDDRHQDRAHSLTSHYFSSIETRQLRSIL